VEFMLDEMSSSGRKNLRVLASHVAVDRRGPGRTKFMG
jgi:hypothetical protein